MTGCACVRVFAWWPRRVAVGRIVWLRHLYRVHRLDCPAYYSLTLPEDAL